MIALNFTEQSEHVHPAGSRLNSKGLKARRRGWWSSRRRSGRPAEARRIFAWRGIKHSLDIWTQESSADISKVQEDHPGRGGGQRSGPAQRNSHVHMVAKNTTVTKTLPSYSWNRCFSYHVVQVYCVLNLLECVCELTLTSSCRSRAPPAWRWRPRWRASKWLQHLLESYGEK